MHEDIAEAPSLLLVGAAPPAAQRAPERPNYAREGPSLLWLALSTAFLTILTLGLYRFWMTTRLRRHYWSAIRVLGDPFEYTGSGLEKLLGFLLALVILAVYLALINLGFAFAGLVQFEDPIALQIAVNLSLLASLPLIYYATYRARRYALARTRWRGIRFGMDLEAWGYTWRALGYSALSLITLGLMYPLQHFRLSKYMIDRTWFGTLRFRQEGSWRGLMGYWLWVYAGIALIAAGIAAIALAPEQAPAAVAGGTAVTVGYFGAFLLGLRYRVAAFRYLWGHRSLGEARFASSIDTGEVIAITIFGSMGAGLCAVLLALLVAAIAAILGVALVGVETVETFFQALGDEQKPPQEAAWAMVVLLGFFYLLMIGFAVAFAQVFVARPILRRQAEGMGIANVAALALSQQRAHDEALEAGGFADALGVDVGAGF